MNFFAQEFPSACKNLTTIQIADFSPDLMKIPIFLSNSIHWCIGQGLCYFAIWVKLMFTVYRVKMDGIFFEEERTIQVQSFSIQSLDPWIKLTRWDNRYSIMKLCTWIITLCWVMTLSTNFFRESPHIIILLSILSLLLLVHIIINILIIIIMADKKKSD